MAETLVEALEAANVSANGGWLIAPKDCAVLFPTLARFASPEVKRGLLRTLLDWRVSEMYDGQDVTSACLAVPIVCVTSREPMVAAVSRRELANLLAPSEAR